MQIQKAFKRIAKDFAERELESIACGFIFSKPGHWLDKQEIRCPKCGCTSVSKIECISVTYEKVNFICHECNTPFERKN